MELIIFVLFLSAAVLLVVGILYVIWRGLIRPAFAYLTEKGYLQPLVPGTGVAREQSMSGGWKYFVGSGVVSVVLAITADRITNMNTPGWWLMKRLSATANQNGEPYDFSTIIVVPIVLDACLIFFVVWAVRAIWIESQGQNQ